MGFLLLFNIYMSIVLSQGSEDAIEMPLDGSTASTRGYVMYDDTTSAVVKDVTSAVGTTLNLAGVAAESEVSGATAVRVVPFLDGQRWLVDCTSNTATNQLRKRHAMTDAGTVANTSSNVATTLGVFLAEEIVGVAANKKLIGRFISIKQVTA